MHNVFNNFEDVFISRGRCFHALLANHGNFVKWFVWNLSHLKWMGLYFGLFSSPKDTDGNVLPNIFVHYFPVILAFNETIGVGGSLVS